MISVEGLLNVVVFLGMQLIHVLRKVDRMSRPNVKNISPYISKKYVAQGKARTYGNSDPRKGI